MHKEEKEKGLIDFVVLETIIIIEEKNVAPTKRTRDGDVVVIKSTYVHRYERCVIYLNILVFLHTRSRTSL